MLLRIWRTGVDPKRWEEYARFEQQHSLPMFRQQPGCLGVLFVRASDGSTAAACSFWTDESAIDRLWNSSTYQATVQRLLETGLLMGTQSVEVFRISGGAVDALPAMGSFLSSTEEIGA